MSGQPAPHMWYVKAAGGVWGPYPEARVLAFVAEGRVAAETPLSPWAEGPFAPAAAQGEFAAALAARPATPRPPPPPGPARSGAAAPAARPPAAAVTPQPAKVSPGAPAAAGPRRALLVTAEVSGASAPAFHAELARIGEGVTLRPGLWLVRAAEGAAALRNRLSRHLGPADTLLVVEAALEQAAWFNLDRDRELRRLWSPTVPAGRNPAA